MGKLGGGVYAKPIRCIRALPANKDGNDISTVFVESDASYKSHNHPDDPKYDSSKPIVLEFKNRLVDILYRERVDNDVLLPHHEDNLTNSFYDGIIVAKGYWKNFSLREIINIGGNSSNPCADYKEDSNDRAIWRVPNLVELSAMNAAGLVKKGTACCTQFSNQNVRFGFGYNGINIYCFGDKSDKENLDSYFPVRCVRDVPAGYDFNN